LTLTPAGLVFNVIFSGSVGSLLILYDWSLNIMVIAWYHPSEYWNMQEWLQRTCLEILGRFNHEGIDFAFPSHTLYLANDDKRQFQGS
jgi:small-conductance mechanosensitive channel